MTNTGFVNTPAATVVKMFYADSLTVESGVLDEAGAPGSTVGVSTIAGEFESPTAAEYLTAATGASVTLITG